MHFNIIDESNYTLFAAKYYDPGHEADILEFQDDLNRIKYLKRLFSRYTQSDDIEKLNIQLALNHIIILYNVFGTSATRILFFRVEPELWSVLSSFLLFLNFLPREIPGIDGYGDILADTIEPDKQVLGELEKLVKK